MRHRSGFHPCLVACCAALGLVCTLSPARASSGGGADLCHSATQEAAAETGIPATVLAAIALTESGRSIGGHLQPWPWTINAGGRGHWFANRDEALRFAEGLLRAGKENFDVGCFQINYRWHGARFASVEAMFDPRANARYAAGFLAELSRETDDWSEAAGAYHSRTPEVAARYRARFDSIHAGLTDAPVPAPARTPAPEALPGPGYDHPLLQAREAPRSAGSLVPLAPVPAT